MPTITDWLMVFVTIVYVIATIFICIANIRSAKASQAQLSEMRHEYEENQRIGVMPYLNIYKCREAVSIQGETSCWLTEPDTKNILKTTVVFQIINHGPGIAVDVKYEWKNVEYSRNYGYVESLSIGGARYLKVTFYAHKHGKVDYMGYETATINIFFRDLLGNQYLQTAHISFDVDSDLLKIRGGNMPISAPKLQ